MTMDSKHPRRWLDSDANLTTGEHAVLSSGLDMQPPAGAKDRVWQGLAGALGAGALGAGALGAGTVGAGAAGSGSTSATGIAATSGSAAAASGAAASGAAASGAAASGAAASGAAGIAAGTAGGVGSTLGGLAALSGTAKAALIGLLGAGAIVSSQMALEADSAFEPEPAPIETTATSSPASDADGVPDQDGSAMADARRDRSEEPDRDEAVTEDGSTEGSDAQAPDGAAMPNGGPAQAGAHGDALDDAGGTGTTPMSPKAQLAEESAALGEIRQLLGGGQPAAALSALAALREAHPQAILGQERDALEIEALAKAGQLALAQARANLFLSQHPDSPLIDRIRPYAGTP